MITQIRGINYYIEHFHQSGNRPTLVMLHGFMGSTGSFFHLTGPLSKVANIVLIDLIGHGETDSPPDPARYSTKEQVSDLKEILQQYGTHIILQGYSMGGRLALQLACNHPELINGLILESTTAGISNAGERLARQKLDANRASQIMDNKLRFIHEWNKSALFDTKTATDLDIEEQLAAIQQAQNPVGLKNSLLGFGTGTMPALHDSLPEINIPSHILVGVNDRKFITEGKFLADKIPHSKFIEIDHASHRVHLDNPEVYLARIIDFLTDTPFHKSTKPV